MAHELVAHPNGAGRVTVSIGVADAIKGDTPEFLLRRAGNGLKIAKREGRNRVVEMTPDGPLWKAERPRLEHDPEKWEPVFGKDHAQNKKSNW